jgi:hypothetical protein
VSIGQVLRDLFVEFRRGSHVFAPTFGPHR